MEADAEAMRTALAAHDRVLRRRDRFARGLVVQAHRRRGMCRVQSVPGPRRGPRLMPRSPRSWHSSCRCGWGWRPARPSCETGDYFGAALNRAARVMAAGHRGQVLLTDSTAGLLERSRSRSDLGPRRLRDATDLSAGCPGSSTWPAHRLSRIAGAVDSNPGNMRPPR